MIVTAETLAAVEMIVTVGTLAAACWSLMFVSGIKYHYETEHCSPCPESMLFHAPSLLSLFAGLP